MLVELERVRCGNYTQKPSMSSKISPGFMYPMLYSTSCCEPCFSSLLSGEELLQSPDRRDMFTKISSSYGAYIKFSSVSNKMDIA